MSEVNRLVPSDAPIEKFVDLPDLLARVEDDRELLTELFAMFQEELPGLQDTLHGAIDVGNLPDGQGSPCAQGNVGEYVDEEGDYDGRQY